MYFDSDQLACTCVQEALTTDGQSVGVIPCVEDAEYAEQQMRALDISTGGNGKDDDEETGARLQLRMETDYAEA